MTSGFKGRKKDLSVNSLFYSHIFNYQNWKKWNKKK